MEYSNYSHYRINQFFEVFREAGYSISKDTTILDFGCGDGGIVHFLRKNDYKAFGCDIQFKEMAYTASLQNQGYIRLIDFENYKIPFDDNTFDYIISDQVFEHVQNYDVSIAETKRVLKKGGACLHFFPSRYNIIEPHIKVPFATILPFYPWLKFWAKMGIRKHSQKGLDHQSVTDDNFFYLKNRTTYLEKRAIYEFFKKHFNEVYFCESDFLKSTRFVKNNKWSQLMFSNKFASYIYSRFKGRVVLAMKR